MKTLFIDLLGTLHAIGNLKGLDLNIYIAVDSRYRALEEYTKNVFKEAFEIIDKNFPRNSTKIIVDDLEFNQFIKKYRGEAPKLYSSEETELEGTDYSSDSDGMNW